MFPNGQNNPPSRYMNYNTKDNLLLQLFVENSWERDKIKNLGEWLLSQKIDISSRNWYQVWKYGGRFGEKNIKSNDDSFESRVTTELRNILPFLLECNNDIHYYNDDGQTILHVYFANVESSYGKYDDNRKWTVFKTLICLLGRGASIYATDKCGKTPLHIAAENKKVELIEQILNFSKYIDIRDVEGNTVLHKVVYCVNSIDVDYAFERIVRLLLSKGADPNIRNNNGMTPLQYAVQHCNANLLQIFKDYKGDFSVQTDQGDNLLHLAYRDSLCDDERKRMETINFFVKQFGFDVNSKEKDGFSLLHIAVERSEIEIVERLIELGADVDERTKKDQKTPLHLAIEKFDVSSIASLRMYPNSNVELKTCISILSYAGADWDKMDSKGFKPFDYVLMEAGNNELLAYVLKFGADINDEKARRLMMGSSKRLRRIVGMRAVELKTIGFPVHQEHETRINQGMKYFKSHRENCLREVDAMKTFMLNDKVSLYQFLFMDPRRQRPFVDIVPRDLRVKFPIYNYTIQNVCMYVKRKRQLTEPAKIALYQVTETHLPDLCLELIIDFMENKTLEALIATAND